MALKMKTKYWDSRSTTFFIANASSDIFFASCIIFVPERRTKVASGVKYQRQCRKVFIEKNLKVISLFPLKKENERLYQKDVLLICSWTDVSFYKLATYKLKEAGVSTIVIREILDIHVGLSSSCSGA